jgi:hypothetical protein
MIWPSASAITRCKNCRDDGGAAEDFKKALRHPWHADKPGRETPVFSYRRACRFYVFRLSRLRKLRRLLDMKEAACAD